jgi:hypothetical protein
MSELPTNCKHMLIELQVADDRDTIEIIEQIAAVLHVDVGERVGREYVQLRHLRHIPNRKEAVNER